MADRIPNEAVTTLYCPQGLRDLWTSPPGHPNHGQLARQWHDQYPGLFDEDDLRLALSQWSHHFYEWFAAIHLFERDGAISMVEKYDLPSHLHKLARFTTALNQDQRRSLKMICNGRQPPDLLVLARVGNSFSFAEVKGKGDRIRNSQIDTHEMITQELKVPVEIIKVKLVDLRSAELAT